MSEIPNRAERLYADIHLKRGSFCLDMLLSSDASRIGVLGASGSGKSLTLRSLAGIEEADSGHIELSGRVLYDSEKKLNVRPQQRNVGYMFQNYALFPTMTVLKNVMSGLRGSRAEKLEKAEEMMRRFGIADLEKRLPGELSGGQQQRVALARILVTEPELILLDEPFSALDGYLRDRMQLELMEMLEDYDGQVVMVSHSRDELYRFSEELFVIKDGRVLTSGETKAVFRDPGSVEAARLTGCKNFSAARVQDEHRLEAVDWGMTVLLDRKIPDDTRYIAYRAHYFEPVWGERQQNCIAFDLMKVDDLPFEKKYYLRAARGSAESAGEGVICWFVQDDKQKMIDQRGLPDYLRMTEENILLLH